MAVNALLKYIFLFFPFILSSQVLNPVHWSHKVIDDKNGNYTIEINGKVDKGWYIYAQDHEGSTALKFYYDKIPKHIEIIETITKTPAKEKSIQIIPELPPEKAKIHAGDILFYVKVKSKESSPPTHTEFDIEYQACNDSQCLAPEVYTVQAVLGNTSSSDKEVEIENTATEQTTARSHMIDSLHLNEIRTAKKDSLTKKDVNQLKNDFIHAEVSTPKKSLFQIFILGFVGGILALFMPCIFPIIPLTISYFSKNKDKKRPLIYGISIVLIYLIPGLIFTLAFGAEFLNELSTSPWVNLVFFILFLLFALSFFGLFELELPSGWVNKVDRMSGKSGVIGVFFMAATLALVSFSCTGPIIGSLLVGAAQGGQIMGPASGMLGFSLGLSLPFTLLAYFPSYLEKLPKSGKWLHTFRVSLGFIELALALKFLSNADLVWQGGWVKREVFILFWLIISAALFLYLIGAFDFKKSNEPKQKKPLIQWIFALLVMGFFFYLLPGLWGAPIKLLSGVLPPLHYSIDTDQNKAMVADLPENVQIGPYHITYFPDYWDAAAYAKEVHKPILIDFTGDACANCRKMEERVWSNPEVQNILKNKVVLTSLYVDRRVELPENEKIYSPVLNRNLNTIGNKWTAFQIEHFQSNSQPLYVIVDYKMNRYNNPIGVEYNTQRYIEWLNTGIRNYYKANP